MTEEPLVTVRRIDRRRDVEECALVLVALGLAPIVVAQVFAVVDRIARTGATVLIVEQNVFHTLQVADRGYVLENGEIVLADASAALLDNDHVRRAYLGI